ncbi:hypothetical protein [Thiothrix sp.]|jgi:hypothetical protein|uniref:hypothetical protein n=1 Tax=Thiothrix sp. TaxID=1032 RepID=UPI0025807E15|nr:hypothetical protein [Thiothrix sp.]
MKKMIFIALLLQVSLPTMSHADEENIEKAIDWLLTSCVTSGSKVTLEGEGDANLTLKSLGDTGASGSFSIKKETIEGLTNKLDKLSQENAENIRDCIAPFRKRVFDMYLPDISTTSQESTDNQNKNDEKKEEKNSKKSTSEKPSQSNKSEQNNSSKNSITINGNNNIGNVKAGDSTTNINGSANSITIF